MYAIIQTGGKQYKVSEGDVITVEKLGKTEGETYTISDVLAIVDDGNINANPQNATCETTVIEEGKHKKVIIYKYKSKKGFHKKKGHRQPYTKLKIEKINA